MTDDDSSLMTNMFCFREARESVRTEMCVDDKREATMEIAKRDELLQIQHTYGTASAEDAQLWQAQLVHVQQEADRALKDQFDQFHLKGEAVVKDYETKLSAAAYQMQALQEQMQQQREDTQQIMKLLASAVISPAAVQSIN